MIYLVSHSEAGDHPNDCAVLYLLLRYLPDHLVFLGLRNLLLSTLSNISHLEPLAVRIRVRVFFSSISYFM